MKAASAALLVGTIAYAFVPTVSAVHAITYKEKILYHFCNQKNCADGEYPSGLIVVNGTLYGTTEEGGRPGCSPPYNGCGTVFSLNLSTGAETVLYSFLGGADGSAPRAGLLDVKGTLYGTTWAGGGPGCGGVGCGTVFSLDPNTGTEKVLHAFCHGKRMCLDGANPAAGLIAVNGTLYGTTQSGGMATCSGYEVCGTVFAINPNTGAETVLHSFGTGTDGDFPDAGLLDVNGTLYGTTLRGGTGECIGGCGTVFALNLNSGSETVLHSFGTGADGVLPEAGLTDVNGTLYGTTFAGGAGSGGTVFALNPSTGAEMVDYYFCQQPNCTDGAGPLAALINKQGMFYGTAEYGGTGICSGGCGTVFSLNPGTGAATELYSFEGGTDGQSPASGLVDVNGTLYGTTPQGGGSGCGGGLGCGAVFVLNKKQ